MSQKTKLPVSIRNLRAKLRLLTQPMLWGSVLLLGLFSVFSWELWSNPEQFSNLELNSESLSEEGFSNSATDPDAIAADIDTTLVLEEDMKGLETLLPPSPEFQPLKPKKAESADISTLTTPSATVNNPTSPNAQGLANIFLSGNTEQTQIDDVLAPNGSSNPMNNMNGSGMNLWWGNGGTNSRTNNNISYENNRGSTMSPLQEAIIRRSAMSNPANSTPANSTPANSTAVTNSQTTTSQTPTTPEANSTNFQESAATVNSTSQMNPTNQGSSVSTPGNNPVQETQRNPVNVLPTTGTSNSNLNQSQAILSGTDPVMPNNAELLMPVSPASSPRATTSQRSYNPDHQSGSNNNSQNPTNSYQYLLNSSNVNSVPGTSKEQQFVNPRSGSSLRTPMAPRTLTQPTVPMPNQLNMGTGTAIPQTQNSGTIAQPSVPTPTQPSVPQYNQPSGQSSPSLRSGQIPQGVQTTVPNANGQNGLTGTGVNSNLSPSQNQPVQSVQPFTVPRPIPGRYIGGGQINTFSNP
jgi:hypothetical protein